MKNETFQLEAPFEDYVKCNDLMFLETSEIRLGGKGKFAAIIRKEYFFAFLFLDLVAIILFGRY